MIRLCFILLLTLFSCSQSEEYVKEIDSFRINLDSLFLSADATIEQVNKEKQQKDSTKDKLQVAQDLISVYQSTYDLKSTSEKLSFYGMSLRSGPVGVRLQYDLGLTTRGHMVEPSCPDQCGGRQLNSL